ncbi:MAG TPA: lysylphosphatidylglycerol synthase transmembrane domain-containing protein [Candidatus Paceibacterota bacterium]|nr:lysylphosphatidylglycerol synthase transmembrane domain-containing protein [Candidatus Paceibacterota bacterium]HSA00918.1 lysylphosphatidylglycerol synthase transmembrane domain-containing protein [Candidatus Paceibacterota bacterium]
MKPSQIIPVRLKNRRPFFWILCAGVSTGLLLVVLRRVNLESLAECLRRVRVGGVLMAFVAFGAACALGAIRWRLMLRIKGLSTGYPPCLRATLAGHFCNTLLFGPAGGDLVKSFLFGRWHRLPLADILAASWLDRLVAGIGSLIFAVGVLILMDPGSLPRLAWKSPPSHVSIFVGMGMVLVILAFWAGRSAQRKSSLLHPLYSLQTGLKQLCLSPGVAGGGVALGVLVQVLLSAVLMLNLRAITETDLEWIKLFWTFPVISLLTALPISVAGLGVRESSAVLLLGWFGVPAAEAIAASLLTLVCNLSWAAWGAGLLLGEERRASADFSNKSLE